MTGRQTIVIIGAASEAGKHMAKGLAGHVPSLLLVDEHVAATDTLIAEIKTTLPNAQVERVDCAMNASWEADLIILATKSDLKEEIIGKIQPVINQKIMIRLVAVSDIKAIPESVAQQTMQVQDLVPHTKLVTVYHTSCAVMSETTDMLISTRNEMAGQIAWQLIKKSRVKRAAT